MKYIHLMWNILFVGVSTMLSLSLPAQPNSKVLTVGYFPNTFPRDPVQVDIYMEHVLLGQILEPLVTCSPDGSILPAVAENWSVSNDSKLIKFVIRSGLKFSNGADVTAKDAKYSIVRHLNSNSQSKPLLQKISSVDVVDDRALLITLKEPYVAIFKALSRDQLGIIPNQWHFDPNSQEPLIGTGPYRAIKTNGEWKLSLNTHYRGKHNISIKEWVPIFFDLKAPNYEQIQIPDLMPHVNNTVINILSSRSANLIQNYKRERVNHFMQLSAWWSEDGLHSSDAFFQKRAMTAIRDLLDLRREKLGLRKATGVIPEGIAGYLLEAPKLVSLDAFSNSPSITVKVAIQRKDVVLLSDPVDLSNIENKYHIRFEFVDFDLTNFDALKKNRPDIVIYSFAGGFYDPEGFLIVLSPNLRKFFLKNYDLYLKASSEKDWQRRSGLYQELGRALINDFKIAPGWKPDIYSLSSPYVARHQSLSYIPKLAEYYRVEEVK